MSGLGREKCKLKWKWAKEERQVGRVVKVRGKGEKENKGEEGSGNEGKEKR